MIEFAWFVLFAWPIVSIVLFQRLSLPLALIATMLGGYLLLPSALGLDLPLLPPLHKNSIASITAFFCVMAFAGRSAVPMLPGWLPRSPMVMVLLVILCAGIVGTIFTNTDTLVYGPRVLRGLSGRDLLSDSIRTFILLIPILLGRKVLAFPEAQRMLLLSLVVAMVIYSFPMLFEIRMSPQLHTMVYGYFPGSFVQQIRSGGFRPIVFLQHGLPLAILMTCTIVAAVLLRRQSQGKVRSKLGIVVVWLSGILVLAKTLGALLIAIMVVPLALLLKPRMQLIVAAVIAGVVLSYPVLRSAHLIPVGQVMDLAYSINPNRASSLGTRLQNEEALMAKVAQRPLFGWGGWGRNRIYSKWGSDVSLTDGAGVTMLGAGGWFRYIGVFGLLCLPTIVLALRRNQKVDPICAALALVLAAKLIDVLPNSGLAPIFLLMAGSLIGRLEITATDAADSQARTSDAPALAPGYVSKATGVVATREIAPRYARVFPGKGNPPTAEKDAVKKPHRPAHPAYKRSKSKPRYTK